MKINESLDFHDLEGQLQPVVSVDEYAAHMGEDSEIVTISFIVNSRNAATDLASWFERGYDWVLDAEVSEGELSPNRYVVFVEISRRSTAPARLIELLDDLTTLTNIKLKEWVVKIEGEEYSAEEEVLSQVIPISPHEYRKDEEVVDKEAGDKLNEMRAAAGLPSVKVHSNPDQLLRSFVALAGL